MSSGYSSYYLLYSGSDVALDIRKDRKIGKKKKKTVKGSRYRSNSKALPKYEITSKSLTVTDNFPR